MEKVTPLCGRCKALFESAGYMLTAVDYKCDKKVDCANCRKRRFGQTYKIISPPGVKL